MAAKRDAFERFSEKVNTDGDCWEWTASKKPFGHGRFKWNGTMGLAHRFAYEHLVGPIPDGHDVHHVCANPSCVNPDHLEPLTRKEHMRLGNTIPAARIAQTHCIHGHEFDEANTYIYKGNRNCRACNREAQRKRVAA